MDAWRAADLTGLDDGDAVGSWTSVNGRTLTASSTRHPSYHPNQTAADGPVVRFDDDWLLRNDSSPVAGLSSFSIAQVFRVDQPGAGGSQWYSNSGIVDAEQGGVTADWGVGVNEAGQLAWGIGNLDRTLRTSSDPSLVDGDFHAVVCSWGDGTQEIFVDNLWSEFRSHSSTLPRNDAGLSFGGIHTGEGGSDRRFRGDLVEVRFYDARLSMSKMTNLAQELRAQHITPATPVIFNFTASTTQIQINDRATLSWNTTNASTLTMQPHVGSVSGPAGSVIVYQRTNTTYVLIASNALGTLTRNLTVQVDQGIPSAHNQSVTTFQNQPEAITLSAADPQAAPLTYHVVTTPAHGSLSGAPPSVTYTPAFNFAGNDQFTFKVNDGEFHSPAANSGWVLG